MPHHDASLTFQITKRCQLNCLHCISRSEDRSVDLPLQLYEKILDQAANYDIVRIGFGGGEPAIHPQFPEMVSYACSRGMTFSMVTNGWAFPKISPILKDYRRSLERLMFSLDGAREETNDYIRGPGTYQRVMEAVEICRREDIPFGLAMVVTAVGAPEVAEMLSLAERLGAHTMWFSSMQPTPEAGRRGLDLPPEGYVEIGAEISRLAGAYNLVVMVGEGSHTPAAWFLCPSIYMGLFTVDARGNLGLCGALLDRAGGVPGGEVVGNLAETSFYEAHLQLIRLVAGLQEARARAIERGTLDDLDRTFPCWYCAKYFHKVDWIADFPGHPWRSGLEATKVPIQGAV